MNGFVLDASAILAYLQNETGKSRVAFALHNGVMSAVNLSEVIAQSSEKKVTLDEIEKQIAALKKLGLTIVDFNERIATAAGYLRVEAQKLGLSLGDRACLALGMEFGLPILTSEQIWKKLNQEKFWVVCIR